MDVDASAELGIKLGTSINPPLLSVLPKHPAQNEPIKVNVVNPEFMLSLIMKSVLHLSPSY